jgi:hypothetical protein
MIWIIYVACNSGGYVQGDAKDRWAQLCQQASLEQDPEKLLMLIREINNLLEEKRSRLEKQRKSF